MVCKPVMSTETVQYPVCVPYQETRTGDAAAFATWSKRPRVAPCGVAKTTAIGKSERQAPACGCCVRSCCGWRCWRTDVAAGELGECLRLRRSCALAGLHLSRVGSGTRPIARCSSKVMKPVMKLRSYSQYTATCYKTEMRQQSVQVCHMVAGDARAASAMHCVRACRADGDLPGDGLQVRAGAAHGDVPSVRARTRCKKPVQYTVCVPQRATADLPSHRVQARSAGATHRNLRRCKCHTLCKKQVQVQVCHMVPKTITCQVPVCPEPADAQ